MCIFGGYKTQTIVQIANILSAFGKQRITLRQLRIYFGCLVITAAREAAKRSTKREKRRGGITPRYLLKELSKLTGCPLMRVRGELRALETAKLLRFSESAIIFTETPLPESHELKEMLACGRSAARPIPIPRTVLRYLANCRKSSIIQTILAYCVRGLSLSRSGEIAGKGTAKASWIAEAMNLSLRAIRGARAELIDLGFITDDEHSYQRKLNRDGAYFSINLKWQKSEEVIPQENQVKPVDNFSPPCSTPCSQFSPPPAQNCSSFSPPYKDKKTPYGSKHQKTQARGPIPSGVCVANTGKGREEKPKLYDVKPHDLGNFGRVEELYFQAVRQKLIEPTEAGAVNFLAAAVRASSASGDTPRIFMGIIRGKLWKNITQANEDRALAALRRYRENNPERFRYRTPLKFAA